VIRLSPAIRHRTSSILHRPWLPVIRHLQSMIGNLRPALSHLSFPILHLPFVICHLSLLIVFLVSCTPPGANVVPTFVPPSAQNLPPGTTVTVVRGSIIETIETRGRVMAELEAPLMFPVGGTLKAVHVSPGNVVNKGTLLAELDAPEAEQDVQMARLDLALAEMRLSVAELQLALARLPTEPSQPPVDVELLRAKIALERAQAAVDQARDEYLKALDRVWEPPDVADAYAWELHLREQDSQLAEAELTLIQYQRAQARAATLQARESMSTTLAIQELQVEMARIGVERARLQSAWASEQVSSTLLVAPLSGVIVSIEKRPGDDVGAYETVGTIADPSELWVVATVLDEDVDRITPGRPAEVRFDLYPSKAYTGTVLQMVGHSTIWQGNSAHEVTIAFDRTQVVPAVFRMSADVYIPGRSREEVLLVPTDAILTIGGRAYVEAVAEDHDIERIEVQTGITDGVNIEILSGLHEGQVIRMP
jgi:RND family efflux transporter MFP subunit